MKKVLKQNGVVIQAMPKDFPTGEWYSEKDLSAFGNTNTFTVEKALDADDIPTGQVSNISRDTLIQYIRCIAKTDKIVAIKFLRETTGNKLGLKEAKEIVESII